MSQKNILIVDDSFVMRALLKGIISADADLNVCGEVHFSLDALPI